MTQAFFFVMQVEQGAGGRPGPGSLPALKKIDQRSLMFNVDMRTKCRAHFSAAAAAASGYM
jgi:hypothetical protein